MDKLKFINITTAAKSAMQEPNLRAATLLHFFAQPEEAARFLDITPETENIPYLKRVESSAAAAAVRRAVDLALTLDRVVVREKLYGIDPSEEGIEFTVTLGSILSARNLSTGRMMRVKRKFHDIHSLFIYRGYLLLRSDCALCPVVADCAKNEVSSGKMYLFPEEMVDVKYLADKTTNPPTLLVHKNTIGANGSVLTRYGEITEGEESFQHEILFSVPLEYTVWDRYPDEIGLPGWAVDQHGRIWLNVISRQPSKTQLLILSPDFQILAKLETNVFIFQRNSEEIWGFKEWNGAKSFCKLRYRM